MERLDFSNNTAYNATEAAIHLNRYAFAKPFCQGAKVLDAACGQGYGSYLMKNWGAQEVVGIDIDEDTVRQADRLFKKEGLCYKQHSVEELPFEDHSFDLVVSLETIEHVDHPEKFLLEIKRVLKPGGTVVISCPNDNYYYENDCVKNPFHKREYTFFEFKEMAERHLGYSGEYYLAFALDGFINIPFEKRTEPEQGICEDALGMLHYEVCDSALCVPQQRFLNHWNANYYIGIWNGRGAQYRHSAVIAPRETFVDHKDKDYDLLRHFDQMQKELTESKEMNSVVVSLREELAASREMNAFLEELRAERDGLLEKCREMDALTAERDGLVEKCREMDALTAERDGLIEKCREMDALTAERDGLVEKCREMDVLAAERDDLLEKCREMDAVTAARDDLQRKCYILENNLHQIQQECDSYRNEIIALKSIEQVKNTQTMELERLRTLLELTRRERDEARQHMHQNWDRYQAAANECETAHAEYNTLETKWRASQEALIELQKSAEDFKSSYMELQRLKTLLDMTRRERDEARQHMHENWDHYQASVAECEEVRNNYHVVSYERNELKNRVDSLESSRGVKLLGKLYNLRERIKKIF